MGKRSIVRGLVVWLALSSLVSVPLEAAAQAPSPPSAGCAEYSDSVKRLYLAYFERLPEQGGFDFWVDKYGNGAGLADMSEFFASSSKEFLDLYGNLSDAQFVDVLYRSVLGRPPDNGGRDFWVDRLDAGIRRGTLMLSFSESEEFVATTETMVPAAGYLRWFPRGTSWNCRQGSGSVPLENPTKYADVAITNTAAAPATARVEVIGQAGEVLRVADVEVAGGTVRNVPNLSTLGAASIRLLALDEQAGSMVAAQTGVSSLSFSVAFYNVPLPEDRPGWTDAGVPVPGPPPSPPIVPEPPVEEEPPPVEEPPVEEEPPPSVEADVTSQGTVAANTTWPGFDASLAIDGDPSTSWFSTGPGQGDSVFVWSGPTVSITQIVVTGNAEHADPGSRTGFGFESMLVEVLLEGEVVFSQTVSMAGTPDQPPPVDADGVVGDSVRLVLSGHEDSRCGGFAELRVMATI